MQAFKIDVRPVHDIERPGLKHEVIQDVDLMDTTWRYFDKCGDIPLQIEQRMEFDAPLAASKRGPRKQRKTEIDRRRIEGINGLVELQGKRFMTVEIPGGIDQHSGEVGIDEPVPCFVGMGQRVPCDDATHSAVVEFLPERTEARFDIPETFSEGDLGERQDNELSVAREPFDVMISLIPLDAPAELRHREKVH